MILTVDLATDVVEGEVRGAMPMEGVLSGAVCESAGMFPLYIPLLVLSLALAFLGASSQASVPLRPQMIPPATTRRVLVPPYFPPTYDPEVFARRAYDNLLVIELVRIRQACHRVLTELRLFLRIRARRAIEDPVRQRG